MKINWKLKSALFLFFDIAKMNWLLFFIQKRITRRASKAAATIRKEWSEHHLAFAQKLEQKRVLLEIGAGKNMGQNLVLSTLFETQYVIDITPMFSASLTDRARLVVSEEFALRSSSTIHGVSDLTHYGIIYKAPFAVADVPELLKMRAPIDAIASTNTFEHIPEAEIYEIIKTMYDMLNDEGLCSIIVDYSDHYAHTDPNIGPRNFLRFSDKQWERHNHNCHYQNRLQHSQYISAFARAGFDVEVARVTRAPDKLPDYIDEKFRGFEDLNAISAHFLLRKRPR